MKLTSVLALAAGLAFSAPAVAETHDTECSSNLQRVIAVPTSSGIKTYLSVNTVTTACAINWHDDPAFQSTSGGDSGGGSDAGAGDGCGDGGGAE